MVENFQKTRSEKKKKIKIASQEFVKLYDIILAQQKLIAAIQSGKYNQGLKSVFIPQDKIPTMPESENFEE
jgi:uncharacterized protein YdbL (DUF1318 family)